MSGPAEQEGSAPLQRCAARLDAVLELAWLAPSAASLAALARQPGSATWRGVRLDPGAVLLVVRQETSLRSGRTSSAPSLHFSPTLLASELLLEDALRLLEQPTGFSSWEQPGFRAIHASALSAAELACRQASQSGCCDPEIAWICALLAPLGWLALCAVDPEGVATALATASGQQPRPPGGLDPSACAHRLARRWGLPLWLRAVICNLGLPVSAAQSLGADPVLLALTRRAWLEAQRDRLDLGLASPLFVEEDRDILAAAGLAEPWSEATPSALPGPWQDPRQVPLMRDLLQVAAENRRLLRQTTLLDLEQDLDHLHAALRQQVRTEAQRLQTSKLEALAELSAGAGHEINNPLAVISMQAQYLLGHQADWLTPEAVEPAVKALQTIVGQTRRIHALLRDLMQFARPAPPSPRGLDLPTLLGEVAASLEELAAQRHVRVEVAAQRERLIIQADAEQLRLALTCLLRNSIEAAPADGWARLTLPPSVDPAVITVAVEDSGPGPEPEQRPHLFDPFFSGHTAGRGRGMGLPVAWRLARQQGGDLLLEPAQEGQPTRFLLTLPNSSQFSVLSSQSEDRGACTSPGRVGPAREAC